jgi:hypothetical protein
LVAVLGAACIASGCGPTRMAELYPQLQEHSGRLVGAVSFQNPEPFSRDSLMALTEAEPTRCDLIPVVFPFCLPGTRVGLRVRRVDLEVIGRDVSRLTALYRQSGFFGTGVIPDVAPIEPGTEEPVRLSYRIERGAEIRVDTVIVEGTEGIADPDSLALTLRLRPGQRFELPELLASSDQVVETLRARGHAYAEVLRNYQIDAATNRATAWLVAIPGPRVRVDGIHFVGMDALDTRTLRRQLRLEEGDLLVLRDLRESQRNLYELELIQFAMVAVPVSTGLEAVPAPPQPFAAHRVPRPVPQALLDHVGQQPQEPCPLDGTSQFALVAGREANTELTSNGGGNVVLDGKNVAQHAIIGFGPDGEAGTDADEQRVVVLAEALAHGVLQDGQVLVDLGVQALGRLAVLEVVPACLGGDGEPRRNRETQVGHLREVRALPAQ